MKHRRKLNFLYRRWFLNLLVISLIVILALGAFAIKSFRINQALAKETESANVDISNQGELTKEQRFKILKYQEPNIEVHGKANTNVDYGEIPSSWNSYEKGLVPDGIRDQTYYPCCWDFAATSSLESSLITKGITPKGRQENLAERQLLYFSFNNKNVPDPLNLIGNSYDEYIDATDHTKEACETYLDSLGTIFYPTVKWMNWTGPISGDKAPYDEIGDFHGVADLNKLPWVKYCLLMGPDLPRGWKALYPDMEWIDMNNQFLKLLPQYNLNKELAYNNNEYHVQNVKIMVLPDNPSGHNLDEVKNAIMEHGGATLSYADTQGIEYNEEHNCYYDSIHDGTNHQVSVVGWDDNFSKNNFNETPPGDGAWLVRNSWGGNKKSENQYCHEGYFWISYYNKNFITGHSPVVTYDAEPVDNYDNNYHYDETLNILPCNFNNEFNSYANVYTAKANEGGVEELDAVSFGVDMTPFDCELQIYKNLTDVSNPTSGTKCFDVPQHVVLNNTGFYTTRLNKPVYLNEGENYAIVLTHPESASNSAIFSATSSDSSYYWKFHQETNENQSFIHIKDKGWQDLNSDNVVTRIKGYTKNMCLVNFEGEVSSEEYVRKNGSVELPKCPDPLYVYTFSVDGQEISGTTYTVSKNTTIKVSKKRIAYSVFYELHGGVNSSQNPTILYLNEKSDKIPLYNPTKDESVFLGWINVTEDKTSSVKIKSLDARPDHDIYLEAIFAKCNGQTDTIIPMTNSDNSNFVVKAKGQLDLNMEANLELDFSYSQIDKESQEGKSILDKLDASGQIMNMLNVKYKVNDIEKHDCFGSVKLDFYLGEDYNGNNCNLYHIHNDGDVTKESGVVDSGIISTTISDLSPFVIENLSIPPAPTPDNNTNNSSTSPQTSDSLLLTVLLCYLIVLFFVFMLSARYFKNRKIRNY